MQFLLAAVASCTTSTVEDLIDVLSTVFIRSLEILKLLLKVLNIRFEARRLGRQPLIDLSDRAENKPANKK